MQYVYPAIFYKDKEIEDAWAVDFPDIDVVGTCGYSLYEALTDAEDTLSYIMSCHEDREGGLLTESSASRIDPPTPIKDVKVALDEYSSEAFVTLIKCDTDEYRKKLAAEKAGE